ncbi:hypothetical protein K435DRAFT_873869 [Dendrothele bispora CBS 962.96]|uniref:Acyl-CoA thioesterase-like N-terminal HotDog domain-containing protein n=1 Tax=Dendrothele bispora (strain CBS 962.96) TaxID=1314807 RepID=A0A4S8KYG9_DENBC|nr:hypothetical protein K435DRAFT_873869 [Dendrothele bispora CBS 962.96]
MAPFSQAVAVQHDRNIDGTDVYRGEIDSEWTIGSVPNGGYVLALMIDACMKRQASTVHPDPLHVTAHFMAATALSKFEIRVKTIKNGGMLTNVQADFYQLDRKGVSSHLIFGVINPSEPTDITLNPPSPYARRLPLHRHPSNAPLSNEWSSVYTYRSRMYTTDEPEITVNNAKDSPTRTNSKTIGGGGIDWASWCGFTDKTERITTQSLAFFADAFTNAPMLLEDQDGNAVRKHWYPTTVMTLEFKSPIPPPSQVHAGRTVGVWSTGKFINEPSGRHDQYTEIWTAPCDVGEGGDEGKGPGDEWRDKQVCLATSYQMALMVPMARNYANRKRRNKL